MSSPARAPNPANFTRFGVNAAGTPRYRCAGCRKIFAFGGPATKGQHTTHRNRDIFQHLMNAMPLRRIVKVLEISFTVLYDRIDFLHEQTRPRRSTTNARTSSTTSPGCT